ncbi:MAG: RNA polymerase sigma factor [Acidobacteria bacterium]|nr:RNA polymerase sigma factor [Acidobacteriota bacterium]
MAHDSFTELLAAAQDGSDAAWAELLEPVAPKLVGYLRLRGSKDPEAAAGDVFVDVARNIEKFSGGREGFASWVFVIAHRRLIDEYRRQRARPDEVLTDEAVEHGLTLSAEEEALRSVSADAVAAMLSTLTAPQRDVIFLRIVGELSVEETARVLNRPISSVKALQRRGLAALKRQIQGIGVSR